MFGVSVKRNYLDRMPEAQWREKSLYFLPTTLTSFLDLNLESHLLSRFLLNIVWMLYHRGLDEHEDGSYGHILATWIGMIFQLQLLDVHFLTDSNNSFLRALSFMLA